MARKPDKEKRARIARQAVQIARERGVANVTMSELAKALGMKRPTLYFYFSDLGEMFEEVLEQTLAELRTVVDRRLDAADHPIDALEAVMRAMDEFFVDREDFVWVLFQLWAAGRPQEPGRVLVRTALSHAPVRAELIRRLREGVARGTVRPCDPERLVDLVSALNDGLLLHRMTRRLDPAPLLDIASRQLLASYKIDPETTP